MCQYNYLLWLWISSKKMECFKLSLLILLNPALKSFFHSLKKTTNFEKTNFPKMINSLTEVSQVFVLSLKNTFSSTSYTFLRNTSF